MLKLGKNMASYSLDPHARNTDDLSTSTVVPPVTDESVVDPSNGLIATDTLQIAERTKQFLDEARLLFGTDIQDPRIEHLLGFLEHERELGFPCGTSFLGSVQQALVRVLDTARGNSERTDNVDAVNRASLAKAVHFMQENLGGAISVQDIARHVGMSATALGTRFKAAYGVTPYRFLLELRIEMCRCLLRDTEQPILDIALECGFSTPQHMATAFRRVVGLSPTAFRLKKT